MIPFFKPTVLPEQEQYLQDLLNRLKNGEPNYYTQKVQQILEN